MKFFSKKSIAFFLVIMLAATVGCKNYSIDLKTNAYSDKFISFKLPQNYVFAFETEMSDVYYNYYTFKENGDPGGSNITYWTMKLNSATASIVSLDESLVEENLRKQYRNKDKTISVYEYKRIDSENYKGYMVYFGIAPFGDDVENSEERTACISIMLARQSDYATSVITFNSVDEATEKLFYDSANTVTPVKP